MQCNTPPVKPHCSSPADCTGSSCPQKPFLEFLSPASVAGGRRPRGSPSHPRRGCARRRAASSPMLGRAAKQGQKCSRWALASEAAKHPGALPTVCRSCVLPTSSSNSQIRCRSVRPLRRGRDDAHQTCPRTAPSPLPLLPPLPKSGTLFP